MSKQNSLSSSENSGMQIADYFIILLSKKRRAANLGKGVHLISTYTPLTISLFMFLAACLSHGVLYL